MAQAWLWLASQLMRRRRGQSKFAQHQIRVAGATARPRRCCPSGSPPASGASAQGQNRLGGWPTAATTGYRAPMGMPPGAQIGEGQVL